MKAIVDLTKEEYEQLSSITKHLQEVVTSTGKAPFETFERRVGYAHYTFSGKLADSFVEALGRMPTPTEVIILADNGFSHFGASCTLSPNGTFSGRVNTD